MITTHHSIDYNKLYGLTLEYDPANQELEVTIDNKSEPWPRLIKAFSHQLGVSVQGQLVPPVQRGGTTLTFRPVTQKFSILMGKEPIGTYTIGQESLSRKFQRPLTVDETRRMGTFYHCGPYSQRRDGMDRDAHDALIETAEGAIFTDFHTHSSGQITPKGLLDVAMQHKPYYYPISLMKEAGIDTSFPHIPKAKRKLIPRVPFPPKERPGESYPAEVEAADLHHLTPDELRKLASKMALRGDHTSTFTELERDSYCFRYPLSKDTKLTHDTLKKMAQEYQAQGIKHAVISFVGLDDPAMFKTVHETMRELEQDPTTRNVSLRFMVGIPRGLALPKIEELLEKTKILMDSPYVLGPDMLGFEMNKTKKFIKLLDNYAAWANEHKPGSCIRVHAGENDKNQDNIKDFLKMMKRHTKLLSLVGHGLHGFDLESQLLAEQLRSRLYMELQPPSNIALDNTNDLRNLPFDWLIKNNISFTVNSDGAGIYQTSAEQLGLAAYYGGLDAKGFARLREYQGNLMQHQLNYSHLVAEGIPGWTTAAGRKQFIEATGQRLRDVPRAVVPSVPQVSQADIATKLAKDEVILIPPKENVPELQGKPPVVIVGASGESWARMTKEQQIESAIAVDMLTHALGDNCHITQGRAKSVGLSQVINQSLTHANDTRLHTGHAELFNEGIQVDQNFDLTQSYKHLTHLKYIHGQFLDLPDAIVDHVFDHEGVLIAIGGAAFTSNIITKADQRGIHDKTNRSTMLLLSNTQGASAEKAKDLHPDYDAKSAKNLLEKLYKQRPDLFPKNVKLDVNKLYEEARARVAEYRVISADASDVSDIQSIGRHEVVPPAVPLPLTKQR